MKRITLLCALILTSLLGCQLNEPLIIQPTVNLSKIENVKILSGISQRMAFSMLNSSEKHFIWNEHFQEILNSTPLNHSQTELVLELTKLNTQDFQSETNPTDIKIRLANAWLSKAEKILTGEQIQHIAYTLDLSAKITPNNPTPDCTCHINSAYSCNLFEYCRQATCTTLPEGCGFLWLQSCNGLCKAE